MRIFSCVAAIVATTILFSPARSEDFNLRFSLLDLRERAPPSFPSSETLAVNKPLLPSIPTALLARNLDPNTFAGISLLPDTANFAASNCFTYCNPQRADLARGFLAYGNSSTLYYLTGAWNIGNSAKDFASTPLISASVRWNMGAGFAVDAAPNVKLWGQIDHTAFSAWEPAGVPGGSFASTKFIGGFSVQFATNDTIGTKVGVKGCLQSFWKKVVGWFAPEGCTPY